jgi:surfactin synthase thioesterase subunit
VQLPGREDRFHEAPVRRAAEAAGLIANAMSGLADLPYALFGHSMGALLAYEVAVRLRHDGARPPQRLFLSAYRAPHLMGRLERISTLADHDFLNRVGEISGAAAEPVDRDVLLMVAPTIRADFELCEAYRYRDEPPLAVPFSCFAAVDDREIEPAEVAAWSRHTTAGFRLHLVDGGHLFPVRRAGHLLRRIAGDLDEPDQPATRDST